MHTRNAFNLYTTIKKVDKQIVKDVDTAVVKSVVAVWSCFPPPVQWDYTDMQTDLL